MCPDTPGDDEPAESGDDHEHDRAIARVTRNLDQDEEDDGEGEKANEDEAMPPYRSRRVRAISDLYALHVSSGNCSRWRW